MGCGLFRKSEPSVETSIDAAEGPPGVERRRSGEGGISPQARVTESAASTRTWTYLVALVGLTIAIRAPTLLLSHPIDDEAVYAVVANEIVHGGRPYVDAIERKPPLLFWTYAAVFKVFGVYNWVALHAVSIAWVLATMAGLYLLVSRLWSIEAGFLAALFYSVIEPWGLWKNLSFNGEPMMLLPVVWAWVIAFGPTRTRLRVELLVAGALVCVAFLMKQTGAAVAVPIGLYLLHPRYRTRRGCTPGIAVVHAAILTIGFFAMLGAVAAILHREGILAEAFYWTITDHALRYIFWNRAVENSVAFAAACLPLLVGAAAVIRTEARWERVTAERDALVAWLIAAAIGTAAAGRFYPHYYIQLVPPLAVLAATAYAPLFQRGDKRPPRVFSRCALGAWFALTTIGFFLGNTVGLSLEHPGSEAGRYLREHATRDARLFMWGQSTRVYVDAGLRPASRYIATFPLTGYLFGPPTGVDTTDHILPNAWAQLGRDLEAHPPDFIVDTEVGAAARDPIERFPMMTQLLAEHYRLLATTRDGTIYERLDVHVP